MRPRGITALAAFFVFGAVMSSTAALLLLFPGSALDLVWRVNPRGREAFAGMGVWAIVLLGAVCAACALAALGLHRGARWGHRLALGILVVQLAGDVGSVLLGTDRRAALGIPVALAILAFLSSRRVRSFFDRRAEE